MQNCAFKFWLNSSYLSGANQSWMEMLYEDFLNNPKSVNDSWYFIFQQLSKIEEQVYQSNFKIRDYFRFLAKNNSFYSFTSLYANIKKQIQVLQLIDAYRSQGHRNADIDPLKLKKKEYVLELDPNYYNLCEHDFQKIFSLDPPIFNKSIINLKDLIQMLKKVYCGSIGIEYMHISSTEEKLWIQRRIESFDNRYTASCEEKKRLLNELIAAEELERYLSVKFPGMKRFSLEGGDVLVPMLKELIRHAVKHGIHEIFLGMTHRGRLNVLINVLGKRPKDLFDEFLGKYKKNLGTGDVKYHMGFVSNIRTENGLVHLSLSCNPSHLEIINPVIIGSVRARLDQTDTLLKNKILPITIHGDTAIAGQGVMQETLNMSKTPGYEVGGTIRIVINNQIGFTTSPKDARSTLYCTDIGKMVQAPVFHVNADDPEAVLFVTRLALDFRNIFKRDVFIDLVCYRRHGHNEIDEPKATQPLMYKKIRKHPTLLKVYVDKLKKEKIINLEDFNKTVNFYRDALDSNESVIKAWRPVKVQSLTCSKNRWNKDYSNNIEIQHLRELAERISSIPKFVKMQTRVERIYADRKEMAACSKLFDWSSAENLAYATLVDKGISIRISGEDSGRGTFFHRHAVIHNQNDGSVYIPLQHIHSKQGKFEIWNSVLSEEAVLAFEYGYAITNQYNLTIWEAQFGDFSNGAQIVIDQFISSSEQKWGHMCGLIMLLPHGYEGQGPEHSSARLERYLQLCAEKNMQVCIPSTPAQIYHMLRRQAFCITRRPLIVMSPKSLLRHPLAVSSMNELANGNFLLVIGEIDELDIKSVNRVVMCTGKVYYDLLENRRKNNQKNVAIIRIEQLYPFSYQEVKEVLEPYIHIRDFIWCQEEPFNQGAWNYIQYYFRKIIPFGSTLRYVGRPASAAPAVGHMNIHQQQQKNLINEALNFN